MLHVCMCAAMRGVLFWRRRCLDAPLPGPGREAWERGGIVIPSHGNGFYGDHGCLKCLLRIFRCADSVLGLGIVAVRMDWGCRRNGQGVEVGLEMKLYVGLVMKIPAYLPWLLDMKARQYLDHWGCRASLVASGARKS